MDRHEQWLIDLDNRVRELEGLHTPAFSETQEPEEIPAPLPPSITQYQLLDKVHQLEAKFIYLQNKIAGHIQVHIDKAKRRR